MILLLIILSSLATCLAGDDFKSRWHQLLHRDIQQKELFWLAGRKATDEKELEATLQHFRSKKKWDTNDHVQCLFPARRMLIEKYLGSDKFPRSKCPDYDEWIARLNPQSVSLVFAGNYPDNPGSLFGHTFLKFKGPDSRGQNLLDYALNYSAEVSDDIGVLYAIKGLVGGYFGGFTLDPYYLKVNEYNEGEGRDIWEYDLELTSEEATYILAHVWELKQLAEFKYYFISDNCSFFIFRLLDIARPGWRLERKLPWYVIPLETVKILHQEQGMVRKTSYRPSVRLRAQNAYNMLSLREQNESQKILDGKISSQKVNDSKVLKVAGMQLASIHSRKDGLLPKDLAVREEEILLRLSELPESTIMKQKDLPSPHDGHDIAQASLGTISDDQTDLLLGFRPGVHDLNDYATGYLPFSELSIIDTQVRVNNDKLRFHKVDFLTISLFRPWSYQEKAWSWSARIAYENTATIFSDHEKDVVLEGALGAASLSFKSILFSSLMGGYYRGGDFEKSQSLGLMGQFLAIASPENWKSINGLKIYQDMNHTQAENVQLNPFSNFAYHANSNTDLQLEMNWPLRVKGFYRNRFQLALKLERHF